MFGGLQLARARLRALAERASWSALDASFSICSDRRRASIASESTPRRRKSAAMGCEMGWPTRACVLAELTRTVGPSLLASMRSTDGDRHTLPVQTARIEKYFLGHPRTPLGQASKPLVGSVAVVRQSADTGYEFPSCYEPTIRVRSCCPSLIHAGLLNRVR